MKSFFVVQSGIEVCSGQRGRKVQCYNLIFWKARRGIRRLQRDNEEKILEVVRPLILDDDDGDEKNRKTMEKKEQYMFLN
ncbi:hypothetical protein PanWU01x14_214610 [Parasponia andersonii]|uniref:Uncharacterized protein n=1 Tax=Parasponia andersonii TaxID=3476 RepID=A0A2P5BS56_PARAD|nr:hypothetical protein PanWU01x14_214610 [Parasponia andersonii]